MPVIKNIQYSTATTGGTITATDTGDDLQIVHENGILTAALTIALPATPQDGQRVYMTSVNGVTALTLSTAVGSIVNTLSAIAVGVGACFMYRAANTKWYKVF